MKEYFENIIIHQNLLSHCSTLVETFKKEKDCIIERVLCELGLVSESTFENDPVDYEDYKENDYFDLDFSDYYNPESLNSLHINESTKNELLAIIDMAKERSKFIDSPYSSSTQNKDNSEESNLKCWLKHLDLKLQFLEDNFLIDCIGNALQNCQSNAPASSKKSMFSCLSPLSKKPIYSYASPKKSPYSGVYTASNYSPCSSYCKSPIEEDADRFVGSSLSRKFSSLTLCKSPLIRKQTKNNKEDSQVFD